MQAVPLSSLEVPACSVSQYIYSQCYRFPYIINLCTKHLQEVIRISFVWQILANFDSWSTRKTWWVISGRFRLRGFYWKSSIFHFEKLFYTHKMGLICCDYVILFIEAVDFLTDSLYCRLTYCTSHHCDKKFVCYGLSIQVSFYWVRIWGIVF